MYLARAVATFAVLAASAMANSFSTSVTYDNTYDNGANSLAIVACSNGKNGLLTKHFTTFDSLPSFPYIGGGQVVEGWNSTQCGTCWSLSYKGKSINVLAIDTAANGFNIAQKALDELTNDQAVKLGRIPVTAKSVPASKCGL